MDIYPKSALPGSAAIFFLFRFCLSPNWLIRLVLNNFVVVLTGDITNYLVPLKNWNLACRYWNFAILTHTYHRFGLSVVLCVDEFLCLLGFLLLISLHMHFIWMPLLLDYFFSYLFLSGIWLPFKEGNENPQWEKPLHSAITNTCLLFISLTEAHFLSVYGIIILCPIDRIQVASDSAMIPADSDLLLKPALYDSSTALWACLKMTMDFREIEPTPEFSPGFRFKFASPGGSTGVPLLIFIINIGLKQWYLKSRC